MRPPFRFPSRTVINRVALFQSFPSSFSQIPREMSPPQDSQTVPHGETCLFPKASFNHLYDPIRWHLRREMLVFRASSTSSSLSPITETSLQRRSNSNPERRYLSRDLLYLSFNVSINEPSPGSQTGRHGKRCPFSELF